MYVKKHTYMFVIKCHTFSCTIYYKLWCSCEKSEMKKTLRNKFMYEAKNHTGSRFWYFLQIYHEFNNNTGLRFLICETTHICLKCHTFSCTIYYKLRCSCEKNELKILSEINLCRKQKIARDLDFDIYNRYFMNYRTQIYVNQHTHMFEMSRIQLHNFL